MKRIALFLLMALSVAGAQVVPGGSSSNPTGAVVGQLQTATGGIINNGTLTFTLSQPAVVSGTASVVTQQIACYTSTAGNIVGVPDPVVLPVTSTNTATGTLAAGTYYVQIYYIGTSGLSALSPEAVVSLTSAGTVNVNAPTLHPSMATGFGVAIGTTSGGEYLQGTVTGWTQYQQSSAIATVSTPSAVNTSTCAVYFSDTLIPTGTYYTVNLTNKNGSQIAGFPQSWCMYGGAGGTINVSQGAPTGNCNTNGVFYPTPIYASAINGTQMQSIASGLSIAGTTHLNGSFNTASSLNDVVYVDGIVYTTVQSAINSFGSNSGLVIVPPNYVGPATYSASIPDNVTVWDYSDNGRLIIYSNPTENVAGSSGAGLSILSGTTTTTQGCYPNALPSANNLVAAYICNTAAGGHPAWAVNNVTNLPGTAPDTEIWGNEIDVNIFGTGRSNQYVGLDVVSGGQVPTTHAVRAYTAPGAGVWAHAFRVTGQMGSDLFEVDSPDTGLTLTSGVVGSASVQTVNFSGVFGANNVGVGGKISVDTGAQQEDVVVTGGAGHTIAGVFTKTHFNGTSIAPYTANRVFAMNNITTASIPYYMGNLQAWSNTNTPQVLGFSVGDLSGTERLYDFFITTNAQRVWRDVGTAGFGWQNKGATTLMSLSGTGQLGLQNCQLGGGTGTASPAACGAAPTGMIAVPASQTSYTVDTTAVTANSEIFIQQMTDNSGLPSSPSCSSSAATPLQSGRTAATSFTFTLSSIGSVTCFKYWIVN